MQISAVVSDETQRLLESTVQKRGLKKGFVIETALRHYLLALNTVPGEFIVPPVLSYGDAAWPDGVERGTPIIFTATLHEVIPAP